MDDYSAAFTAKFRFLFDIATYVGACESVRSKLINVQQIIRYGEVSEGLPIFALP